MIKNIILDIGGILFDDSKESIEKVLNKNCDNIYKIAYGNGFKKCILGEMSIEEHINKLKDEDDFEDISYILRKDNLSKTYPLIKNNYEYIKKLKEAGYNLYLLSNITEDSYNYINDLIDINKTFNGGIYSYKEHIRKPDPKIFELIIKKYKLKKEETVFFDDKEKNIKAAKEEGIKAFVFKNINDIERIIKILK